MSLSILLSSVAFTGCSNEISVTFVSDNGTIVRKIRKGENLDSSKMPNPPQMQGKYCLWDEVDYPSLTEDVTVNYTCYDSVDSLTSNVSHNIEVEVSSPEADLDYIFRDLQITATLSGGRVKKLYKNDYIINTNGYNKDIAGTYRVGLAYNNKEIFINIKVNKITDYVTAVLGSDKGYLNEGLPTIFANTTVPGTIKFDDNQTLVIGTSAYDWTFTPQDINKYEVIHGKSEVSIINADRNSLTSNKADEVMTFEYGTSKAAIINAIEDGLVVTATFADIYREIDPQYYIIDSDYVVGQAGDNIPFTIAYDADLVTTVYVNVKKNENYTVSVREVEKIEITSQTTLDDLLVLIEDYYEASAPGVFTFEEGETIKVGNYTYQYVFTPDNKHFASKRGEIDINTVKVTALEIDASFAPNYAYNSANATDVEEDIKTNLIAKFVYNDSTKIDVDNSLIDVEISGSYKKDVPGKYTYTVIYDDIRIEGELTVEKRKLVFFYEFDVEIVSGTYDPNNPDVMPEFTIINISGDFDEEDFRVVPDLTKEPVYQGSSGAWLYPLILQPSEEVSDIFDVVYCDALIFVI